jgi:hypothetical protein
MKNMKLICSSLLLVTGAALSAGAEQFRTDINPALQYYQAYLTAPDLSDADRKYLFNNEANWRGQKLPERFGELVARYDNEFKLTRHAARATVPCDWGIDMSPGPATLLPQLARDKAVAQAARLRAMWDLQQGRPAEASDDLIAALALGRNCSRDGTVISTLVQLAIENIVYSAVAENFYQFSPESLKQLADGFDAAPPRGTVAACVPVEKAFFHDWMIRKILELQEHPGNQAEVMAGIHEIFASFDVPEEGQTNQGKPSLMERVHKAAGGSREGVLKLLRDEEPFYQKLTAIMALPEPEYDEQMKPFSAEVQNSPDPLISEIFSALQKSRPKEFATLVEQAMVRAAIGYKIHGEQGFKSVTDPCGQGPFEFQRFVFEGVDRGFELKSAYAGRGFQEVLIFVEKDGAPFNVYGKNVGQAMTK